MSKRSKEARLRSMQCRQAQVVPAYAPDTPSGVDPDFYMPLEEALTGLQQRRLHSINGGRAVRCVNFCDPRLRERGRRYISKVLVVPGAPDASSRMHPPIMEACAAGSRYHQTLRDSWILQHTGIAPRALLRATDKN